MRKKKAFSSERTFPYAVADLEPVARGVGDYFRDRKFEVTEENSPSGAWQVSITKGGLFKLAIGLKAALNIELHPEHDSTHVTASVGIFGQQAVAVGLAVFRWPFIVPTVWGLVRQAKLDDEAIRVAGEQLAAIAPRSSPTSGEAREMESQLGNGSESAQFCTSCGAVTTPGAQFCANCGKSTMSA